MSRAFKRRDEFTGAIGARDCNLACSYWDLRQVVNLAVSAADLPPLSRAAGRPIAQRFGGSIRGAS
jgi:hypothetical protein